MTVVRQQYVALSPWVSGASITSASPFTPTVGNLLIVFGSFFDQVGGSTAMSVSGTGTYSVLNPPGQHADTQSGRELTAVNVSATGGSQTATVTLVGGGPGGGGFSVSEYSGANTAALAGVLVERDNPGTGAGAIQGTAVVVPVGGVLTAWCQDISNGTGPITNTTDGSTVVAGSGTGWCVIEYAGAGASITPKFTSSVGAATDFTLSQVMIPPLGTSKNLTAQTASFTEGTIVRAVSTALTGQTATFSEGTISPAAAYGLTGQSATFTEGALTPALAKALTGQTATFSLGTITPSISYGLTAQTATFTEGTITPSQGAVANLTAQTATFSVGTITLAITYGVTGQTAAFVEGLVSPQASYGLTGQTSTFTEGTLSGEVDYALTGLTATFAEGTITAQAGGDVSRSLTGLSASFSVGLITVTGGDQPVSADTHDPLPKRRKRQFDDGAQTQVIRESQLKPKKAKAVTTAIREIADPQELPAYIENPEDEDELLALIQDQDEQLISTIELATHLLRTLH